MVLSVVPDNLEAQLSAHPPTNSGLAATGMMGFIRGPFVYYQLAQWQPAGELQVTQAKHLPMMLIVLEYITHTRTTWQNSKSKEFSNRR